MSRPAKSEQTPEVHSKNGSDGDAKSQPPAASAPPAKEKYFRVKFHAKSRPEDEDDVTLSVNGEVLVIARQREVVLPERYIVCAQNARYQQFRQLPNMSRKVIGEVHIFPFDSIGEATEAEYKEMRAKGTAATRKAAEEQRVTSRE